MGGLWRVLGGNHGGGNGEGDEGMLIQAAKGPALKEYMTGYVPAHVSK